MKNIIDKRIIALYHDLRRLYGRPQNQWKLWCQRPKNLASREEVIIGAILTQRTSWRNVELAIGALKKERVLRLASMYKLAQGNPAKLKFLIRSCGFSRTKVGYLKNIAEYFIDNKGPLAMVNKSWPQIRRELLKVRGVGPETADSILLYALDKPVFVIDEYTKRLVRAKHLTKKNLSYDYLQNFFMKNLPRSYQLYQDFHALIIVWGKAVGGKKS